MKMPPVRAELYCVDGQTDMMKLIVFAILRPLLKMVFTQLVCTEPAGIVAFCLLMIVESIYRFPVVNAWACICIRDIWL
jgi:hypothetical protein